MAVGSVSSAEIFHEKKKNAKLNFDDFVSQQEGGKK